MATILKQCHDCGALFQLMRDLLSHQTKQHGWTPVGSSREVRTKAAEAAAKQAKADTYRLNRRRKSRSVLLSRFV